MSECRCRCHVETDDEALLAGHPKKNGTCWWCAPAHGVERWTTGNGLLDAAESERRFHEAPAEETG